MSILLPVVRPRYIVCGSLYEKLAWREGAYEPSDRFLETRRGFFFKVSYLWRM